MNAEEIKNVAVIGAGLMGHGIAMEFALAGLNVHLYDISGEKLNEGMANIRKDCSVYTAAGLVTRQQVDNALEHITTSPVLEDAARQADFVVEAVLENLELKRSIFSRLDSFCPSRTIIASNTSSFLPSLLAAATHRPDKVLVTHYFNPPMLLPLVEVVKGKDTSDETTKIVVDFLKKIGKTPAIVRKEVPGFIGNRLQVALLREALSLVEEGVASPWDVDIVIKNSFGRRLSAAGVFEVFEIAGWDLIEQISLNLLPDISSSTKVSPLLHEKVRNGELGLKTGRGFYEWTSESSEALRQRIAAALIDIQKMNRSKKTE